MIIKYSDLQLVVINYAMTLESLGLSAAAQFLQKVLWIANEALKEKGKSLELRPTWNATFVIPSSLLRDNMDNRQIYLLMDMVLDLFEEDQKIQVVFEGETLALLDFPFTE